MARRGGGLNTVFRIAKSVGREIDRAEKQREREAKKQTRDDKQFAKKLQREAEKKLRDLEKVGKQHRKEYLEDAKLSYQERCEARLQLRESFVRKDII